MSEKRSDSCSTVSVATVYEAARDGAVAVLSNALQRMSISERNTALETKTKDGDQITTPLIIAAFNGNLDSVKILLEYKADIEARGTVKLDGVDYEGSTPLWAAVVTGHIDVVKQLIERRADVDGRNLKNSTPLNAAAYHGRLDIVNCLVENGADINAHNNFLHHTPLMIACYKGHMNVVTYLIERGANIDLQDKEGNTALHGAVEGGHLEIANKLLALGASQLPNIQRLTPLLLASNCCKIDMVEYLIKRPECTKEQRIEGLELLGATIASYDHRHNDSDDIELAFAIAYMKRGMEERFQDKSCPLLKKQMEPLEAYQNRKESQTLEELAQLEDDNHAIHMEGLLMRERILGKDNTVLRYLIEYRGEIFSCSGNYELCFGLWEHAIEIGQRCNVPIIRKFDEMAGLFSLMLYKQALLRPECVERVFEKLIIECERQKEKLIMISRSMKMEEHEHALRGPRRKINRLMHSALYLLKIYTKLQVIERKETTGIFDLMKRFLCLNPRTHDGNTLLHLAAWYKTERPAPRNVHMRLILKLPCVEIMKLIMHAGCNVNAINTKGNSPLHLAVTFKPSTEDLQLLRDVLETLLDGGIHEDLVNSEGQTAMDVAETDEARWILSAKRTLKLKCIAARAVRKFGLCYVGIVPKTVERYISTH